MEDEHIDEKQSRLNNIETHLNSMDTRLNNLDSRLNNIENRLTALHENSPSQDLTLKDLEEHLKGQDKEAKKNVYGSYGAFGAAIITFGVSLLIRSQDLSANILKWDYIFIIAIGFGFMGWYLYKQRISKTKL